MTGMQVMRPGSLEAGASLSSAICFYICLLLEEGLSSEPHSADRCKNIIPHKVAACGQVQAPNTQAHLPTYVMQTGRTASVQVSSVKRSAIHM